MQAVIEAIYSCVAEAVFWSVGAAIKKLLGRPLSLSGYSEQWIGLSAVLAIVFLAIWWAASL